MRQPAGRRRQLGRHEVIVSAMYVDLEPAAASAAADCDRTVIREAQNLDEHRDLPTHIAQYFRGVKSLIACVLNRFEAS